MVFDCNGIGSRLSMDPARIVPDPALTIRQGAVLPWQGYFSKQGRLADSWGGRQLEAMRTQWQIDFDTPWRQLPKKARNMILFGSKGKEMTVLWNFQKVRGKIRTTWEGLVHTLMRRHQQTESEGQKKYYARFMSAQSCPTCKGRRLKAAATHVRIVDRTIVDVTAMTIAEAHYFLSGLRLDKLQHAIADELLKEIVSRLGFLLNVGLDYLSLDRKGPTLSGGESQRIRLASQVGSELTGVLYILDEPTIGLHQRDNLKLLSTLQHLRDIGDSVVVIEHDRETMLVNVGAHSTIRGLEHLNKVINIDQRPIGRTPRSNPATYTKLLDYIRNLFARLPESRMRGYAKGRFSFNVKGGRCEACRGDGYKKVTMHFLADVYVPCEQCQGRRYNDATLAVRYKGHTIADVLELSVRQARAVFQNQPRIMAIIDTLMAVGLGYIKLGQSAPTLSGGEAQRIKLSRELAKKATGDTLYILDEPTTGLHFDDIVLLIGVLRRLVKNGNSVVIIEHNLDVIKIADWIIDLGPDGGDGGGRIVAQGSPEIIARRSKGYTARYLKPLLT
jgi:excinuclease UvrABC ATPase subunit